MDGPSRDQLAAVTRQAIERHDEWDSMHEFIVWTWDGQDLAPGTVAIIDPAMHPQDYPALMGKIAAKHRGEFPAPLPYAFLLQIEAFGVTAPGNEATDAERRQFDRDRLGRKFHERPDAVESCIAYCADIHGRLFTAGKRKGHEGISEAFYPPGKGLGGRMIKGLLAVAYATGMADHGLPGPPPLAN